MIKSIKISWYSRFINRPNLSLMHIPAKLNLNIIFRSPWTKCLRKYMETLNYHTNSRQAHFSWYPTLLHITVLYYVVYTWYILVFHNNGTTTDSAVAWRPKLVHAPATTVNRTNQTQRHIHTGTQTCCFWWLYINQYHARPGAACSHCGRHSTTRTYLACYWLLLVDNRCYSQSCEGYT